MSKYDELMNKIEVTPEMRSRILSNIAASVNDEQTEVKEVKEPEVQELQKKSFPIGKFVKIAVPIAAAAAVIIAVILIAPRLFGNKGATSGSAAMSADNAAKTADSGAPAPAAAEDQYMAGAGEAFEAEMAEEAPMEAEMTQNETQAAASITTGAGSADSSNALAAVPGIVFYTNHHIPLTGAEYPSATLVTGRAQLEELFMTDSYEDEIAAQEFLSEMECSEFTDEFFKTKDVLIVLVEEGSGSISHVLTGIDRPDTDSPWTVHIRRRVPEMQTGDMAYWYIVAEVEKGILENAEIGVSLE